MARLHPLHFVLVVPLLQGTYDARTVPFDDVSHPNVGVNGATFQPGTGLYARQFQPLQPAIPTVVRYYAHYCLVYS